MDKSCIPICATKEQFNRQVNQIKLLMSWIGFPSHARSSIIKHFKNKKSNQNSNKVDERKIVLYTKV